jgi:hypothetical protein
MPLVRDPDGFYMEVYYHPHGWSSGLRKNPRVSTERQCPVTIEPPQHSSTIRDAGNSKTAKYNARLATFRRGEA